MVRACSVRTAARIVLAGTLPLFTVLLLSGTHAYAGDSGCVDCHTDIDLLEETRGEQTTKKSALQSGAG